MSQNAHEIKLKRAIRKGIALRCADKTKEALQHYDTIREFIEGAAPEFQRHFHCGLGRLHRYMGQNEKAIKEYEVALRLPAEGVEAELEIAAINCNIAYALIDLNRPSEAHAFLDHAEEYFTGTKDDANLGEVLETRARVYLLEGEAEKAKEAADRAFDLLRYGFDSDARSRALETLTKAFEASRKLVKV